MVEKWVLIIVMLLTAASEANANTTKGEVECVILLHGLVRTHLSMNKIEEALQRKGYKTVNKGYASRKYSVEVLSESAISNNLEVCETKYAATTIHFVTHSMGGILVRHYLAKNNLKNLGRVVMLSPPNQGSEAVDRLSNVPGFYFLNGPAGGQLGTGRNSVPKKLGPANFEVGIITGSRSINLFLSLLIPGKDDGKVSIESAKLEGMSDFLVLPHTHVFIMKSDGVIDQIIYFLKNGRFDETKSLK